MLIEFSDIVSKYGLPRGIIHIGAHKMEERKDYLASNINDIIWIEANPELVEHNLPIISDSESIFQCAISNQDDQIYDFHLTNNGESSSILDLHLHKIHHPHIHIIETINVNSKRMDTLIRENSINIKNYDFINLDIQGAELLALKGFGDVLSSVKYIYTEVNTNYIYKNCCLINEIDDFLSDFSFERKETYMTEYEWGDALYIR
tara:strand:- start:40 stop:654 length:615 start_codon:yes stop_codon:yes gene_type:complete